MDTIAAQYCCVYFVTVIVDTAATIVTVYGADWGAIVAGC